MEDSEPRPEMPETADLVVAVGGSGARTRTIETFLAGLPLGEGMTAVVVLQHREALDEPAFREALARAGHEVLAVADEMRLESGRIFLAPANAIVTLERGRFRMEPAEGKPGERGTIDSFLVSLARNEDGQSIAVLFDGTGGDGSLGVNAVKEVGGLTLAEEPEDADPAHLAGSQSPAALADFLLPAEALAERVAGYRRHIAQHIDRPSEGNDPNAALAGIAAILRNKTGHDFHGYKTGTFLRRVHRRMQVVQADSMKAYVDVLRAQSEEAQELFNDLLIGVTQFFRDAREFELLEREVIPKLFEGKTRGDQLRIWVIGCSTGEEAYSLAILLRERMASLEEIPQVQIFATDLDGRALAAARVGRYTDAIVRDVSPERLARWFVKEGTTYCVVKEIREMCIFSQHSIIKDAPFSRLDLVSCRNLLIYLDAELQGRVIPLFHFALKPRGYLFLGNSENVSRHTNLFASVESRARIFQRIETGVRVLPDFPFTAVDRRLMEVPAVPPPRAVEGNLARTAERIVERYAPAYVIADREFNVLHFSGRTGRYIDPAGGAATLNLLSLAHPDLRLDLRVSLNRAAENNEVVQASNLRLGVNGHSLLVDLVIEPIQEGPAAPRCFMVLFKEVAVAPAAVESDAEGASAAYDQRIQRLEQELRTANERLQATVEELESTNEELKSSNEEYQSLNEELQSANEELETSKEELQSVNEELTTVNGELAHRVQELGRTNSDLKNLLESTQIATIFLDNELRVMNYTPAVTEIFHLVETDVGRPIAHIKSRLAYDDLQDDVRRVLRTLGSVEREIENPASGTRYMIRVLPYRSIDNFIGGAVVTFIDMTPLNRAQEAMRESEKRLRTLMEGIPQLVWRAQDEGNWTWSSPQWMRFTGQNQEESLGIGWLEAIHPDDRERAVSVWKGAQAQDRLDVELRVRRGADGAYLWHHTRAVPLRGEPDEGEAEGAVIEWLGTATEVQQLKELQERQGVMVAELQHRTRNLLAVVRSIADQTMAMTGPTEVFQLQFKDRLNALSRVQGLLSRPAEESITIGDIVGMELSAMGADVDGGRIEVSGPRVSIRKSAVQTFALALHELATNARKYGALSRENGHLVIRWNTRQGEDGGRRLLLEWIESGVDAAEGKNGLAREDGGYGRHLIEKALPYSLGARTSFELSEAGVFCTIDMPLEKAGRKQETS